MVFENHFIAEMINPAMLKESYIFEGIKILIQICRDEMTSTLQQHIEIAFSDFQPQYGIV